MSSGSKLFLGKADEGAKITHEDFAEAEFEEPWRYERVKGRLTVMPPAGHDHHATGEPFRDHFVVYKLAHPDKIDHVFEETWIIIDGETDRIADLAIYLKSPRNKGRRMPRLVPDAVVETASEGSTSLKRDYAEKRDEYERAGVKEYVIVNRFDHCVTVFRRSRGRFTEIVLGPDDVYTSPLFPRLEIPLKGIIG